MLHYAPSLLVVQSEKPAMIGQGSRSARRSPGAWPGARGRTLSLAQQAHEIGAFTMQNQHQSASAERVKHETAYFELQATWGVTKHLGGTAATDQLVALCHIDRNAYVLDVSCGTGITPRYLAQTVGCRVMGLDISERMIGWARRKVRRAGIDDHVTLCVAVAQRLPFADATFDAVIKNRSPRSWRTSRAPWPNTRA